jgi:hypothetical protein
MNGVRIHRSKLPDSKTLFIPLPPEARKPITGGCQCAYCTAHPEEPPEWDTLAVHPMSEFTFTVHAPELRSRA